MIRIPLDQNIHSKIEPWLQAVVGDKATATSTRTLGMQRMSDDEIFLFCQNRQMVIVTFDDDFQNPLVIENIPGYGVVRLNIYPSGFEQTRDALKRLIENYPVEMWEFASIVVDFRRIRYRKKMTKRSGALLVWVSAANYLLFSSIRPSALRDTKNTCLSNFEGRLCLTI